MVWNNIILTGDSVLAMEMKSDNILKLSDHYVSYGYFLAATTDLQNLPDEARRKIM